MKEFAGISSSSAMPSCRNLVMDACSSGEEVIVKTRKPYTITKQREKWTEEEHNKFLEALKLYGRAWQRIEEHIGTKTAVQIRSHAQKFFSKLEKEALAKGIPLGQAHGIEIPPPRPKRKPNNPYPQKTSVGVLSSPGEGKNDRSLFSGPLCSKKRVIVMETDAPREDVPSGFVPPEKNGPAETCTFMEVAPPEDSKEKTGDGYLPAATDKEPGNPYIDIGRFEELSINTQMKLARETSIALMQTENIGTPRSDSEGSGAACLTSLSNQAASCANHDIKMTSPISVTAEHHASTSMSSVHQPFAVFPPFAQFCGVQDAYRSLNMSSAFSSLIVSILMQNPAAHAAASLAASIWPASDIEASTGSTSEAFVEAIPARNLNASPSMAAIAAATVAAASAWWATHGLLPFCLPAFHGGFPFSPASAGTFPRTVPAQATEDNKKKEDELTQNQTGREHQTADLKLPAPGIQSSPMSSSDSDESRGNGRSQKVIPKGSTINQVNPVPDSGLEESGKARSKNVDRSSCGSNTPSSSEVETDTILENIEKGNKEAKDVHLYHTLFGDTSNRRLRGGNYVGESWKEVSQEGRLAFQALFSREVLPQSFSPPLADGTTGKANDEKEAAAASIVDLNSKFSASTDNYNAQEFHKNCFTWNGSIMEKDHHTNDIGQMKLKSRRTGFKPYKRCSMEAKESRAASTEEKDNKRIRLEDEAST